jgi:adenylate kinase
MRLVMLGGPGSGKGTQAKNLSKQLKLPIISLGDILRQAIAAQTPLGINAQPYVEKGELLPDSIMIQFVKQRLTLDDVQQGWILEGYPRTAFQGEELDFLLEDLQQPLNWAIYLKINENVMIERSLARSLFDDLPDVISKRIAKFHECTVPILEYYDKSQRLVTVDGLGAADQVTAMILSDLNDKNHS